MNDGFLDELGRFIEQVKRGLRAGWLPDIPDFRDFKYSSRFAVGTDVKPETDFRSLFSPVEDQGSLGSCTANAIAGALELLDKADGNGFVDASRLYIYYYERLRMMTVLRDSGAYLRDGIKVCAEGYADEVLWPYDIRKFKMRPSKAARDDARKRRLTSYYRIESLAELKDALSRGIPVVFGFSVYNSMMTPGVMKSGVIPMPKRGDRLEGGHAVCAAGYSDSRRAVLIRNSWGDKVGEAGYFWLPYGYLESRDLSDDIWALVKQEAS